MRALPEQSGFADPCMSIDAFEAGNVDPDEFGHDDHVYVAWLYLQDHELNDAIARFCAALKGLTRKLGIQSKYHETITWFFMIAINERRQLRPSDDWHAFRRQNPDIFESSPSLISRHYSGKRLQSPLARTHFLLPDRLPD